MSRVAAMEQATAQMDRMAVDDDDDDGYVGPAVDDTRQPHGTDGGGAGKAVNGPSSSAQPPDRPPSSAAAPPSAPASGGVAGSPLAHAHRSRRRSSRGNGLAWLRLHCLPA